MVEWRTSNEQGWGVFPPPCILEFYAGMQEPIRKLRNKHFEETIFVIAGGPSASAANLSIAEQTQIREYVTISVNLPPEWLVTPTYCIRHDKMRTEYPDANVLKPKQKYEAKFLTYITQWRKDKTTKTITREGNHFCGLDPDYVYSNKGFDTSFRKINHLPIRSTTTTAAVWLAHLMGARIIAIIGLDVGSVDAPGGYAHAEVPPHHWDDKFGLLDARPLPAERYEWEFGRVIAHIHEDKKRTDVFNGNPDSKLDAIAKRDIHEFLATEQGVLTPT